MKHRAIIAALLAILATAAQAQQDFITLEDPNGSSAWWIGARFHAVHGEVRGIPAGRLRSDWCKATEFTKALFPQRLMIENGTDVMAASRLSFAVEGNFDHTRMKQVALVGVYETCAGEEGGFLLILDQPSQKVRFLQASPKQNQFSALTVEGGPAIRVMFCMECDHSAKLAWNRARKAFAWVKERQPGD